MSRMKQYQNLNMAQPSADFEDVVIIKRTADNKIIPIQIYYANNIKIKYPQGLYGTYAENDTIITYTADLPETNNGIITASEFSPFGRSIIGKKAGEKFIVCLPDGNKEEYTIISIIDKKHI